ncbi:N-6 DNA methylase [Thiohalocapsa sp. ML1]|uniref:methylation-associated defense system DNA methyltransferase MAD2 n=1 Tax=Thiohalocapsa sp. ML1 TaxID=1431688 RepID=UPI0009EA536C|nr:N-6 DNA methylase [Thiohalocapsa sp. ML1]
MSAEPATECAAILEEGRVLDYITGKPVKDSAKEQVRQHIARALFHEYGISVDDMAAGFKVPCDGRVRTADIAIFEPGTEHTPNNLRRIVVCQSEPKSGGKKRAVKLRDHEQARKDLEDLKDMLAAVPAATYGLWTNRLDFFFLKKQETRFDTRFEPLGDWPLADGTLGSKDVVSEAYLRRATPEMLRIAFRRCHNYIHGNEGMAKDAAFWQFLYLIFAKMYDERTARGELRRFWAGPTEQFDSAGQAAIRARIEPLFAEVKRRWCDIFGDADQISLSDRALAFMVSELAKYDFRRTGLDAKGAAYQEIVGTNLRGDKGQYFTPGGAVKLMVAMLDPQEHQRFLDPACGTGSFPVAVLEHMNRTFREAAGIQQGTDETTVEFLGVHERLREYTTRIFAADFDPALVRATQMNILMASDAEARVFHMNSLEFPGGSLSGVKPAQAWVRLGTMDLVMTNPPFGSDIPITEPAILSQYELACTWERTPDGGFRNTGTRKKSVAPEVLFIERCVQWLKEGGRMGIVLPDGILGNPGDEYIRWWILRHCWVLASVDLPVEAFIVEANVNILTSLLFLKKKTHQEKQAEDLTGEPLDYPVFMAVAEKVGFDRRGAPLFKRSPEGEELLEDQDETERVRYRGEWVTRTLKRKRRIPDNDLPAIAAAYRKFRAEHPEPGASGPLCGPSPATRPASRPTHSRPEQ